MRTLPSSRPRVVLHQNATRGFCSSRVLELNKLSYTTVLPSKRLVSVGLLRLTCVKHNIMHPVLLPDSQVDLDTSGAPNQETDQLKTVRVKIQLQKECSFGEEFIIVGDDPMFGLWDPENGISSSWSDGHVWIVELDIPIGKSIEFKFILKGVTGTLSWQPGPNRTFQTWETENTIVVSEDWEDAALQKVIEAKPSAYTNGEPTTSSEMLVTQDLTQPAEESASNLNGATVTSDVNDSLAKNVTLPTGEKPTAISNVVPPQEKPSTIIADNISQQENPSAIIADNICQQEKPSAIVADNICQQEKPPAIVADNICHQEVNPAASDKMMQHDVRDPTVLNSSTTDVQENMITPEEEPVLVPGLSPISVEMDDTARGDESEGSTTFDALVQSKEVEDRNLPELEEKHETDGGPNLEETTVGFNGEMKLDSEIKHTLLLAREERHHDSKHGQSNVLENDMKWGQRTLQKFLTNLGFL